jgi:hypothetical protein
MVRPVLRIERRDYRRVYRAVHESYTQAERDNLSARLTEYKKWFLGKKFKVTEPVHVGSIVVLPIENEAPNYRDDLPT